MSYDLYFFKPVQNETHQDTVDRVFYEEEQIAESEYEAVMAGIKEMAAHFTQQNPRLETFIPPNKQYCHISLSEEDSDTGIQIEIHRDHAYVNVPYWHSGEDADLVFKEIWGYSKLFYEKAGFLLYDPQSETFMNPVNNEFSNQLGYGQIVNFLNYGNQEESKPWWKFW